MCSSGSLCLSCYLIVLITALYLMVTPVECFIRYFYLILSHLILVVLFCSSRSGFEADSGKTGLLLSPALFVN